MYLGTRGRSEELSLGLLYCGSLGNYYHLLPYALKLVASAQKKQALSGRILVFFFIGAASGKRLTEWKKKHGWINDKKLLKSIKIARWIILESLILAWVKVTKLTHCACWATAIKWYLPLFQRDINLWYQGYVTIRLIHIRYKYHSLFTQTGFIAKSASNNGRLLWRCGDIAH